MKRVLDSKPSALPKVISSINSFYNLLISIFVENLGQFGESVNESSKICFYWPIVYRQNGR